VHSGTSFDLEVQLITAGGQRVWVGRVVPDEQNYAFCEGYGPLPPGYIAQGNV
jgi:hypothetical protein